MIKQTVKLEEFPNLPMEEFFAREEEIPEFFSEERWRKISELAAEDKAAFGDIVNFVTGKEKEQAVIAGTTDLLVDIEEKLFPELTDEEAYKKVASFRKK